MNRRAWAASFAAVIIQVMLLDIVFSLGLGSSQPSAWRTTWR